MTTMAMEKSGVHEEERKDTARPNMSGKPQVRKTILSTLIQATSLQDKHDNAPTDLVLLE
jgi:hypothetical protein